MGSLRKNKDKRTTIIEPSNAIVDRFLGINSDTIAGRFVGLCSDAVADKNRQRPYRWAYTTLRSNRSNVLCYVAPPHFVAILFKPLGPGGRAPVIRESKEGQGHLQFASLCFSCNRRHTYRQRGPILK